MNTGERMFEGKLKGYCCSEIIMDMALEDMGWPEDGRRPLIRAMGAYCNGLHEGLTCGTLCAAKSVLWLAAENSKVADSELGPEMMSWFEERFGSWNCADLLQEDFTPSNKALVCPIIVEDTYIKLRDMLEDIGAVD